MSLRDRVISFRCVMLRYNPIRHPVGLLRSGNPGRDSPVVVSGNYFHTVKRLERVLVGTDCWLLVADSAGINVWCAAGVCDFNEHKIADAAAATDLAAIVSHRRMILPQLAAVGVDLKKLKAESGFAGIFGPASLDDLPAFLAPGGRVTPEQRLTRFTLSDRLHIAMGMFNVFLLLPVLALVLVSRAAAHLVLLLNLVLIYGSFILYHVLPFKYPSNNVVLLGLVTGFGVLADGLWLRPPVTPSDLAFRLGCTAFVTLLVAIDMLGQTPFYKTTIGHWLTTGDNESLFQPRVLEACTGCGSCARVCPKGLFELVAAPGDAPGRKRAEARLERACCECLACVKQCPATAIVNANGRLHKDDIKSVPDLDRIMRADPAREARA